MVAPLEEQESPPSITEFWHTRRRYVLITGQCKSQILLEFASGKASLCSCVVNRRCSSLFRQLGLRTYAIHPLHRVDEEDPDKSDESVGALARSLGTRVGDAHE